MQGVVGLKAEQLARSRNWVLASHLDTLSVAPTFHQLHQDHAERLKRKDFAWYDFTRLGELGRANLRQADLSGANLQQAVLSDVPLDEANLSQADLRGAPLSGTSLYGAILERADLRHVDLSGVLGLTRVQIGSAMTDSTTVLPTYLQRQLDFGSNRQQVPPSP